MSNSETKSQEKSNFFRVLWPDVKTEKGQKDATKAGAMALCCLILFYAFLITMLLLRDEKTMKSFANESEFTASLAVSLVAIPLAGLLAWLVFKRQSLLAAAIGLAWITIEIAMKLSAAPGRGGFIAFLILLYSINGLRGTLAAKKTKPTPVA